VLGVGSVVATATHLQQDSQSFPRLQVSVRYVKDRSSYLIALCVAAHALDMNSVSGVVAARRARTIPTVSNMSAPPWMTEEEYTAAMPAQGADHEDKFICKVCNKTLSTRTSLSHFTKHHDYDLAVVRKWMLTKDMNAMGNKTRSRVFADGYRACEDWLSEQYIAKEAEGIANEAEGGEVDDPIGEFRDDAEGGEVDDPIEPFEATGDNGEVDDPIGHFEATGGKVGRKTMKLGLKVKAVKSVLPISHQNRERHTTAANIASFFAASSPSGSAGTASATDPLSDISKKLDKLLDGPRLEVDLPEVMMGDLVRWWAHPEDTKLRHQCPISKVERPKTHHDHQGENKHQDFIS
jgi:hypothetical protein